MLAVGLATLIVRRSDDTIYRSQLKSRAESPAHRILTGLPLLAQVPASDAMMLPRCVLVEPFDRDAFTSMLEESRVDGAPYVDSEGRYLGVITWASLRLRGHADGDVASEIPLDSTIAPVYQETRLDVVLDVLTSTPQTWATVIDEERRVLGTISLSDIVRNYQKTARTYLRRLTDVGGATGVVDVVVEDRSSILGLALRSPLIPRGVLVTSIDRGRTVIRPNGDTVLQPGDRLTVLGSTSDVARIEHLSRVSTPTSDDFQRPTSS